MAICQRGFLMVRNMRTGDISPFFLKVREQDIIWKDQVPTRDDVVDNKITDNWLIETHTYLNRASMSKRTVIPALTYVSTRKATGTITLPMKVNATTSAVLISKESGDSALLQNCSVEANLIEADGSGLSEKLQISLISSGGEWNSTNVGTISGYVNISIIGFSK